MITNILKKWIAQSESWQTYIDFKLHNNVSSSYDFLSRPDDFYISLFGSLYEALENPDDNKDELLSIAKGLEIYSLKNKKEKFSGIDQANNVLFAAGLYYLADYSSSASILSNLVQPSQFQTDIQLFLLAFLKRKNLSDKTYSILFNKYLHNGNIEVINELLEKITQKKEYYLMHDPMGFSLYYLVERIMVKFSKSNIWIDLLEFDSNYFWNDYIKCSINKKNPVWDFFPSQKAALDKGILGDFKSIALQTPTSSGKTAICELLIYNEFFKSPQKKILYLAPYRSLASELKFSFGKNLKKLGINSKTIYGGNIPTIEERNAINDVTLLIATPEKFMAIENIDSDFSESFNMIICDEGHLLDVEGQRGLSYELLLSRLKKKRNMKFVFLSAIIPNIDKINTWLGGSDESVVKSSYRATEIEFAFLINIDSNNFSLEVNPHKKFPKKYTLENFLTATDLMYNEQLKTKLAVRYDTTFKSKSAIISLKALNSGSVAVFTPTKGGNGGVFALSKEIIDQVNKKPELFNYLKPSSTNQNSINLKEYFEAIFGPDYLLNQMVEYGFIFHHGDLPQYVREIIEDSVRSDDIKLVVSTRTLAEGVNLPIKTIVVHTTRWFDPSSQKQKTINLRDLKNLFGRAGRAGIETKGLIIIPNPSDFNVVSKVIKDEELPEVEGYLYFIVKIIKSHLDKHNIDLSNQLLDSTDESFKELIDSIDRSIIDLLSEDVEPEDLEHEVLMLIKETFAYFQADDEEKRTLENLLSLRGQKLIPHICNGNFPLIKKNSSSLRLYEDIDSLLDINDTIWLEVKTPDNDDWIDYIINSVFSVHIVSHKLLEFNERNFTSESNYLDSNKIKLTLKLWLDGEWFLHISKYCNNELDIALRLINTFFNYNLGNAIGTFIHIAHDRLSGNNKEISQTILDFPQYLLYGFNSKIQLDLVEIGFSDRLGILCLSEILSKEYTHIGTNELKDYLNSNSQHIIKLLKNKTPIIVVDKIIKNMDYLLLS